MRTSYRNTKFWKDMVTYCVLGQVGLLYFLGKDPVDCSLELLQNNQCTNQKRFVPKAWLCLPLMRVCYSRYLKNETS